MAWGTVYLAESNSPPRRVALKVMREGATSARLAARFAVERLALAAAEHDFVVRLYDSGVTDEGRPWLALEPVEGLPLLEHCDRRRLDVEARLRLFAEVCAAVQHLHERGILHRDLKPENILVGPRGVPKVIDLGLARLDGLALADDEDSVMGTPAYMAPEQLSLLSGDLDERCDVYSLGLILRDLLVGPRALHGRPFEVVPRTALDDFHPSAQLAASGAEAAAIARKRSTRVAPLRRRLRGPLDRIAARAGASRREDRHASVAELGADVARDLDARAARRRTLRSAALAGAGALAGLTAGFLAALALG